MITRGARLVAVVFLCGCRATLPSTYHSQPSTGTVGCHANECADSDRVISVTYLGTSGLLIEHRGHVLLTAPFFSNPRLGLVRPKFSRLLRRSPRIAVDTQMVERWLPKSADLTSVILVGHAHYDHLMDDPYIATRRALASRIY